VSQSQSRGGVSIQSRHPELVSGSSHCDDEGSPLTPTLSRRAREKRVAFTLAEVLITLAIIGVVATMTIPTLVADYQERSWNTSATVFDRKLTEALKIMNSQGSLAGFRTTESFVNELSKHLKITRVCSNDNLQDCFSDKVYWRDTEVDMKKVTTATHFGQNDWDTNIVGVQLANGTSALIAYNPTDTCKQDPYSNQINGSSCLAILYDTSGFKSPNTNLKDIRNNQNVKSLAGGTCAFVVGDTCYGTPFDPEPHKWNACTEDGTSTDAEDLAFMEKYDLKYCLKPSSGTEDYWAGAVEQCGGVDKMPDQTQLQELAMYLYPDIQSIGLGGYSYCPTGADGNYTSCKKDAASLGFTTSPDGFSVWSGKEYLTNRSCGRIFTNTYTVWFDGERAGNHQAVCLGD